MSRRGTIAAAAGAGLIAAAVTAYVVAGPRGSDGTSGAVPSPTPTPTASETAPLEILPAAAVLDPLAAAATTDLQQVAARLAGPLAAPELGPHVGAAVVDLRTGQVVYGDDAAAGFIPASTAKVFTTTAALAALGPAHRFDTRVLQDRVTGEVVLVGGGDPMLSRSVPAPDAVPGPTSLSTLADRTADSLRRSGATTITLRFDDTLFDPGLPSTWEARYLTQDTVSRTSALSLDGGRVQPGKAPRSPDPAQAAADEFARLLGERGIAVTGAPARGAAPTDGRPVAVVRSAPLADIVEHVLLTSDNDAAEVLARHVALASGQPATADAAAAAVTAAVAGIGVDVSGVRLLDGSGLSRASVIPPQALADVLVDAAAAEHPELRSVISGLPVAGFDGTLTGRYDDPSELGGRGVVRAKTGSLNNVNALAGTVVTLDGEIYAFAFLADQTGAMNPTRDALDVAASSLAACGCAGG